MSRASDNQAPYDATYARALAAWHAGRAQETWEVLAPSLAGRRLEADGLPTAALACAALLRVGNAAQACALLAGWPATEARARRLVLQARADFLGNVLAQAQAHAEQARVQAQQEGDVGALLGAVTLLGELSLLAEPLPEGRPRGFAALHILAQGLRVAEQTGTETDAHLLSVLAAAQRFQGPRKAQQTAAKALERSTPGSPARVGALLLLGRTPEARAEQAVGPLAAGWLRVFE